MRAMTQAAPFRNPVRWEDIEPRLTNADKVFIQCMATGLPCIFGDGKAIPQKSNGDNTITSEVIRFLAYGGDKTRQVLGATVHLQGAWVSGPLFLFGSPIRYGLAIHNCRFEECVVMTGAQCPSLVMNGTHLQKGLRADSAKFDGNVMLRHGFVAKGEVQLNEARIGGSLNLEAGKFHNPEGRAIFADGLMVDGNVYLVDGFSAKGQVRFTVSRIGGGFDGHGATFSNPGGDAIHAAGMIARSQISLTDARVVGGVRLVGARTDGKLDCSGGSFQSEKNAALNADSMIAEGGIVLKGGFSAKGEVRLLNARTRGDLDCTAGQFINPHGKAFGADRVQVEGTVFLNGGFKSFGETCMVGARIGGMLDCSNSVFCNPGKRAFVADGVETGGDALLSTIVDEGKLPPFANGEHPPIATFYGETRLLGARIGGTMSCTYGVFFNPGGIAFNAEDAEFRNILHWLPVSGAGTVDLNFAKTNVLADIADAWKPFEVSLDGFTYNRFARPESVEFRLDWLGKRATNADFSPLPYEQAAKVLRAMGKDIDAWDIEREKRRLERAERDANNALKVPPWRRLWGRTIDTLTDFVYRPWKTLGWAVLIVLASALLFDFADENGRMVPHQPVVLAHADYKAETIPPCAEFKCPPERRPTAVVKRLFPDYPEFNALVYSADVFIPFFALHQEPYWYPNPSDADREVLLRILPLWYWLEIGAGWILTSLFLLSVTGVLRPRQSSGEKG